MRSATSYFNGTLYRKTMARFWPLWGLWGVIWMFMLPLNLLTGYLNRYRHIATEARYALLSNAMDVPDMLGGGLLLALFFAVLCAMAVFGYLYNHRSACWTHALPLRREALFTTQYLAGLSMLLLPLAAAGILTAAVEMSFLPAADWGAVLSALLTWLLAQSGICLFFFSFACFCAMFTGHILALPAFYGILNALASVLWFLVDALMNEFYYGYAGTPGALTVVEYLTPAVALRDATRWYQANGAAEPAHLQSPATVAVYAAVGAALAVVSLYVYRRRHVETAGDVVAVAVVRPLFKYGVSFCAGLSFGMFTAAFFGWTELPVLIPCILVWAVIGCFAAEMLLKKSFRVLKAWKGAAVMAAVLLVLCLSCLADIFGVVSHVPDPGRVESVWVELDMGAPYDSGSRLSRSIKDPAQIEKIVALHRAIVDNRNQEDNFRYTHSGGFDYIYVTLNYKLAGGGLDRRYISVPIAEGDLDAPGSTAYALKQIVEDRELAALAYDFDGYPEKGRLTSAWLKTVKSGDAYGNAYGSVYVDDYRQELWDAVRADFAEGTIGVRYPFDNSRERQENTYMTDLVFGFTDYSVANRPGIEVAPSANYTLEITLTPNARRTLAVLDETGLWEEGYSLAPWVDYSGEKYPDTAAGSGWEVVY